MATPPAPAVKPATKTVQTADARSVTIPAMPKAAPVVNVKLIDPPATPVPATLPTTYKGLCKLGKDTVEAIAVAKGVAVCGLGYGEMCGAVLAKIKPVAAAKTVKPTTAAKTVKADAPATYPAGTVLIADGKGGFRLATEADLWAALESMTAKKAA